MDPRATDHGVTADPRVTVVMITHNRRAEADRSLRMLAQLPERPRVVVVDNGSTDGTAAMVRSIHPDVTLLEPGRNLGAIGRNVAVEAVDTPYVAFCDDDTWYDAGALACAADLLDAHPRLAVVNARIIVEPSGRLDAISREMAHSPLDRPPGIPGYPLLSFLAGVSVVRREAFVEAGGFSPRLWLGGEEELLAAELASRGWHLAYVPEVSAHHFPSTLRDADRRRRDGIRNTLWFTWLRRPAGAAVWRTLRLVRRLPRDWVTVQGLVAALAGLPWVVRERRVVPPQVEEGYRRLEHQQLDGGARRYVS
jgi:GT2 family glycosyltransferase